MTAEVYIAYELTTPAGVLNFNPAGGVNGYYLREVQGMASLRSAVQVKPTRDGGIVYDAYRAHRQIVLSGYVKCWQPGQTQAQVLAARADLIDDLLGKTNSLMRGDGTLKYTPTGNPLRRVESLRLIDPVPITGNVGLVKEFQIAMVSPDPIAYTDDDTVTTRANTGSVNVTNAGNVDVFPVIRVDGPWTAASAIVVSNSTTGLDWRINDTAGADADYVEVDHRAGTVVNQAGDSWMQYLNVAVSDFFPLVPGVNAISLAGSGMTASTTLTITHRDGWV